jgi:serine acetyltransferase
VPDHCVVAGVPARVVREHTVAGWRPTREEARFPLPPVG